MELAGWLAGWPASRPKLPQARRSDETIATALSFSFAWQRRCHRQRKCQWQRWRLPEPAGSGPTRGRRDIGHCWARNERHRARSVRQPARTVAAEV